MKRKILIAILSILIFPVMMVIGCSQNNEDTTGETVQERPSPEPTTVPSTPEPTNKTESEAPTVEIEVGERSPAFF